jgi:hypothetical protein
MKKKFDMSNKRQVMMIIAIICVVCFVVVFLVSAIHFGSHSGHANISARSCQRTLMPECRCDSAGTPVRIPIPAQTQSHMHSGSHVDCFVCVIVQKTVEQVRQLSVAEIMISDLGLLILTGLCFMFIISGVSTPVKLKTRTNN